MNAAARQFEISRAVRKTVGLLIGLVGPSSSGKTYSALRLASGIQRIAGGDIDFIDTENGRALYYADKFKFNHLRFAAPFSPDDYLEAVRFCARRGAKTIVIDSMSHEHEGPGGVLEWHERLAQELALRWKSTVEKTGMAAWGPPKTARRRLINELLQLNVNLIMTFRAKEKIKVLAGKDPKPLGWQPICGEEFMYEMVLQALLLPGSEGRPVWNTGLESERAVMKLPSQFSDMFDRDKPAQFDEAIGERLATWAAGGIKDTATDQLIAEYAKCEGAEALKVLEEARGALWKKLNAADKERLKEASGCAQRRLAPKITLDQATVLRDGINAKGIGESLLLAHFELGSLEDLPAHNYASALALIETGSAGGD